MLCATRPTKVSREFFQDERNAYTILHSWTKSAWSLWTCSCWIASFPLWSSCLSFGVNKRRLPAWTTLSTRPGRECIIVLITPHSCSSNYFNTRIMNQVSRVRPVQPRYDWNRTEGWLLFFFIVFISTKNRKSKNKVLFVHNNNNSSRMAVAVGGHRRHRHRLQDR